MYCLWKRPLTLPHAHVMFFVSRARLCAIVPGRPQRVRNLDAMVPASSGMMPEGDGTMKPRLRTRSDPLCMVCAGLIRVFQTLPIGAWAGRVHTASPVPCFRYTSVGLRAPSDAHIASEGRFIQ